jgi:hypothetical protein
MLSQVRLLASFSLITDSEFQYNYFFSKKRKNEFGKPDGGNGPYGARGALKLAVIFNRAAEMAAGHANGAAGAR